MTNEEKITMNETMAARYVAAVEKETTLQTLQNALLKNQLEQRQLMGRLEELRYELNRIESEIDELDEPEVA